MSREKDLLAVSCPPVCPSFRTYQCGSQWKDFRDIWDFYEYLGDESQIWLKSDKNIGHVCMKT